MADADSRAPTVHVHAAPRVGTRIEVRTRFDGTWSRGFEIADVEDDRYRVKRTADGSVLPGLFGRDEIRRERGRATW